VYSDAGMLLRAAAASTSWLRIWFVTGTFVAGPVVVVVDDRGTELLDAEVVVGGGALEGVDVVAVLEELEQLVIVSATTSERPAASTVRFLTRSPCQRRARTIPCRQRRRPLEKVVE
jgi:hypothetical protein